MQASVKNNAAGALVAGIGASATTIILATGQGGLFPASFPFWAKLEKYDTALNGSRVLKREVVKVTGGAGDTFTVIRSAGYCPADYQATTQGNTAFSFDAGDAFVHTLTAEQVDDIQTAVAGKLDIADYQNGTKVWGASSTGSDAYAITLSPAPAALLNSMSFRFQADVTNTGPATLDVNGLGAKTIKKQHDRDLADGDIEAGQIVVVCYDGTNFQMDSQVATIPTVDINGLTEDTTPDISADFIMEYDASV
jgi:hypothetical protein